MSNGTKEVPWQTTLRYLVRTEKPESGSFGNQPVRPGYTDEVEIGVYLDDESIGPPNELVGKPLQVQLAGSARALEELGKFLVALARLETANPTPHDHFEDVRNAYGGTIHLIVERLEQT